MKEGEEKEGREVESFSVCRGDARKSSIWKNLSGGCEVPLRVPV